MVDFLPARRHLLFRAPIHDGDRFGAQAQGRARRVHRHVAAADDGDFLRLENRRVVVLPVSLHQVDPREELVGGVDAHKALPRDVHEPRKAGPRADEHGLKAVLEQLVDRKDLADHHVRFNLDALPPEAVDLPLHNLLGQAELRDAVHQHAAGGVQGLEHRDRVPHGGEVARAGQASRPGPHHGDLMPVLFDLVLLVPAVLHVPVGGEALQPADADRVSPAPADAVLLALIFLRAHAPAHGGQRIRQPDGVVGALRIPLRDGADEIRDMHAHRAAADARLVLAVQAARSLPLRQLLRVAEGHLVEVLAADLRRLFGHRGLVRIHIRHFWLPPVGGI